MPVLHLCFEDEQLCIMHTKGLAQYLTQKELNKCIVTSFYIFTVEIFVPKGFLSGSTPLEQKLLSVQKKVVNQSLVFTIFFVVVCFDNSSPWFPITWRIVQTSRCGSLVSAPSSLPSSPASPPSAPRGLAVWLPKGPYSLYLLLWFRLSPRMLPSSSSRWKKSSLLTPYPSQSQPDSASS